MLFSNKLRKALFHSHLCLLELSCYALVKEGSERLVRQDILGEEHKEIVKRDSHL